MSSLTEREDTASNILIVTAILCGVLITDYFWNVRLEMRMIWPQFWKSAEAKAFVIARYVGLVGQIFNVFFVSKMASGTPIHPLACRAWLSYQVFMTQILLIPVEILLTFLAHKMYNNNKYILSTLPVFIVAQLASMAISVRMVFPELAYSASCLIIIPHPGQIYISASTIAVNLCILAMILWRYFRGNWLEPLRSYLKTMVRNSIGAVILILGNFLAAALVPVVPSASQTSVNIIFHTLFFSLWFAAGRLVVDKEKFQSQSIYEQTEVDLDNLEPIEDPNVYDTKPSDSKVAMAEVSTAVDSESVVGTEDIADYDGSLLNYTSSIVHEETRNSGEGSWSGNQFRLFYNRNISS